MWKNPDDTICKYKMLLKKQNKKQQPSIKKKRLKIFRTAWKWSSNIEMPSQKKKHQQNTLS